MSCELFEFRIMRGLPIEPSDEGEEQAEEKQKSTPGAIMKHWNCDDTRNDIVLHLNLLLLLERAIVLPLI